jgi:hypothetical protein
MSLIKQAALSLLSAGCLRHKSYFSSIDHTLFIIFLSASSGQQQLVVGAKGNFYFIWTGERTSAFYLAGAPPPARPPKSFAASREKFYIFSCTPGRFSPLSLGAALFVLEEGAGEVINSFLLRRRGATREHKDQIAFCVCLCIKQIESDDECI